MPIHSNSLTAYHEESPNLSRRARSILNYVRTAGPRTDRQIMAALGYSDMNAVRPRITELVKLGLLRECGDTRCPVTRKRVRVVSAVVHETQSELF